MFTGIVASMGNIVEIVHNATNVDYWVRSTLSSSLTIDQSVSHNGVCLTVVELQANMHRVTAIAETLSKTTLSTWVVGTAINLELCLQVHSRLDGHYVTGHIDSTATCTQVVNKQGSWEYTFAIPHAYAAYIIEKGSIALNGTSLTIFNVTDYTFTVAIIPYTYEHTTIQYCQVGTVVNVEYDIIGKYILRMKSLQ